jgi:hypothetical protein
MGARGLSHDYVKVDRPRSEDGQSLVMRSDGFHVARPTTYLSDDVCAVCGYGPADVRGRGKHTAIPAVDKVFKAAQR